MKSIHQPLFLLSLLLLLLVSSCGKESSEIKSSTFQNNNIPELLDRHPQLQHGKEWEKVQNHFVANRNQLFDTPDALKPRLELAQLYIGEARVTGEHGHYYPAALQMIDELLQRNPTDEDLRFRALSTKAGVELSLHQFGLALQTGKEALQLNTYNAQIYGVLVDAYVELGEYKQAVQMADKMMGIRPDMRSYARVSYLREIHGQLDGAIEAMQMAVSAAPPAQEESAWAMLTLGKLYQSNGQDELAEQAFRQILEERPDYPFAIAALGELYLEKEQIEKAESHLLQAIGIIPEVGFYFPLAEIYQNTGREKEARQTIVQILQMLEEDSESGHVMNLEFAEVYTNLAEDYTQALQFAQKEYKARPNNIDVNRQLASIYTKMGDTEKAKLHAQKGKIQSL